jgi:hypothetical protein
VNKSPGTSKVRHVVGVIVECRATAETVDETMLSRGPADKSRQSRSGIFLTCPVVSSCGKNEIETCVEKAAEDRIFRSKTVDGSTLSRVGGQSTWYRPLSVCRVIQNSRAKGQVCPHLVSCRWSDYVHAYYVLCSTVNILALVDEDATDYHGDFGTIM